jgi:RIO kinase 1
VAQEDRKTTSRRTARPTRPTRDDEDDDPLASTYLFAEHGPEPVPDWVITQDAARQYELGLLKTGKEAEVFLVERELGDRRQLLAAKRYRKPAERSFRDDARYRSGRKTGDRRIDLAVAKGTQRGREFRGYLWAGTEFETLGRLWSAGVPVPYPVQRMGTELMLEFIGDGEQMAPRLSDAHVDRPRLATLCESAVDQLHVITHAGVVHGDLSPYNVLVWDDTLVFIDFPQAVDPQEGPDALELLHRDVTNLIGWFARKGVDIDPDTIFRDLLTEVFR